MTKLHLDVYSSNFTSFKIKLEADGSNRDRVPFTKHKGLFSTGVSSNQMDCSSYKCGY
jgi:hypothetical protein